MATAKPSIYFHHPYGPFPFPNRNRLKAFLSEMISREKQQLAEINFIFCTDDYLLKINQQFLHHDAYPDIITFPFSKKGAPLLADIYISVDRVKENARRFQVSCTQELYRVIFHGILHLCGYQDKKKQQIVLMRSKEEEYLGRYGVPRGTSSPLV